MGIGEETSLDLLRFWKNRSTLQSRRSIRRLDAPGTCGKHAAASMALRRPGRTPSAGGDAPPYRLRPAVDSGLDQHRQPGSARRRPGARRRQGRRCRCRRDLRGALSQASLDDGFAFLRSAGASSLRTGSCACHANLDWVLVTHTRPVPLAENGQRTASTAFRGWGHRFLCHACDLGVADAGSHGPTCCAGDASQSRAQRRDLVDTPICPVLIAEASGVGPEKIQAR
jgi:hypothetical protein